MFLRVGLFIATNLAVLFVLNLILTALGVNQPGSSTLPFLAIAGVMGMAGSFISLLMSKSMARRSSGAQLIETPANETERWLVERLQKLSMPAQMQAMGVSGGLLGAVGLKKLTMTHPPLEERIAALRDGR